MECENFYFPFSSLKASFSQTKTIDILTTVRSDLQSEILIKETIRPRLKNLNILTFFGTNGAYLAWKFLSKYIIM